MTATEHSTGGWLNDGGKWYYLDPNTGYGYAMIANGRYEISGKIYCFRSDGSMVIGWYQFSKGWRYYNSNGYECTGWIKSGGKWYYMIPNSNAVYANLMQEEGWRNLGGKTYHFNKDGSMTVGWYYSSYYKAYFYYDSDGAEHSGWLKSGGKWYYLNPDALNAMACNGWLTINEKYYYFTETGAMVTGWGKIETSTGTKYVYLDVPNGNLVFGWKKINYKWYYFDPNNNGFMVTGSLLIDGRICVFDSNGVWLGYAN